jgi:hypothetical protein
MTGCRVKKEDGYAALGFLRIEDTMKGTAGQPLTHMHMVNAMRSCDSDHEPLSILWSFFGGGVITR